MRIRDLKWKDLPAWPPEWWISDEGAGEEGFLKDVQLRRDQNLKCLVVVASHLGVDRNGIVLLEDPTHLEILWQKLEENIGMPLSQIGDLEVDLAIPKKGLKQVRPLPQVLRTGLPPLTVKVKR